MLPRSWLMMLACGCLFVCGASAKAQDFAIRFASTAPARTPTPIEDDAQLYDVQFVSAQLGWAAGDHGVIWHTADGGNNWQLQQSGVKFALRSVCFLTDAVGWIAGGGTMPFTHQSIGVVLHTTDGGKTWLRLAAGQTPQLFKVKFFDLQHGVVAGDASTETPTGVMFTEDGGKNWRNAAGAKVRGWRTGDFTSPQRGAVAGMLGKSIVVSERKLLERYTTNIGLRGLHDLKLNSDSHGWLVGDGGFVRTTNNGGIVWKSPPHPLPDEVRELFDFRAVATHGQNVWIAGRPGSVIWHSPHGGTDWTQQPTGQTVPIFALSFASADRGCAVGAMGMILKTENGGKNWVAVRGGERRAALLAIHTQSGQVSLNLSASLLGELGYRGVVSLLPRRDVGPSGETSADLDARLHEAVVKTGGSAGDVHWRFPLSIPGLEKNSKRLYEDWMRRTEGRLPQLMLGQLVLELRMWRPSVIVLDKPAPDDAVGHMLVEAIQTAVQQAADPTRFVKQRELAALAQWKVSKLYLRLPAGSTGDAHIDPHQFLPQFRASAYMASALAYGRLSSQQRTTSAREAYRLLVDHAPSEPGVIRSGEFFAGIHLAPGGDARRARLATDDEDYELRLKIANRQRNLHGYLDQYRDDPRYASQLVAQVDYLVSGMTDAEAALQLAELGDFYQSKGDWELAEGIFAELVENFPGEPPAQEAMRWLFRLWTSAETSWRRVKISTISHKRTTSDKQSIVARLQSARPRRITNMDLQTDPATLHQDIFHVLEIARYAVGAPSRDDLHSSDGNWTTEVQKSLARLRKRIHNPALAVSSGSGIRQIVNEEPDSIRRDSSTPLQMDSKTDFVKLRERIGLWQQKATRMADVMQHSNPTLFGESTMQFPLAALFRKRGLAIEADNIYRRFAQKKGQDLWARTAASELWFLTQRDLPPKPIVACRFTDERPALDGVLSDACWENADEIPLSATADGQPAGGRRAFAMLAYDESYLYFAASLPRSPETPQDMPLHEGRTHDADLSHFDRVSLFLDIDRDYATSYAFTVDQRGWTRDVCWNDATWNPKWYVFARGAAESWRIEIAIPLNEIVPAPPARNTVWAVGIVRTIPAVGLQSWTRPASQSPRPESFGLVRFD